jgi:hypothetical protein
VEDCSSIVFAAPTYTRRKVEWPPALVRDVERRARKYPFLARYGFAITDDA